MQYQFVSYDFSYDTLKICVVRAILEDDNSSSFLFPLSLIKKKVEIGI